MHAPTTDANPDQHTTWTTEAVLDLLHQPGQTYDTVRLRTGWSRGKIYDAAYTAGRRKTETRIHERAQQRRERQLSALTALLDEPAVTADVLDFLADIPDDSISAIVTSVPYNIGVKYANGISADAMRHLYYCSWLGMIVSEVARTLKPNGSAFLQVGNTFDEDRNTIPIDYILYDPIRMAGLRLFNRIIWPTFHGLTPKHHLANRYEIGLWICKGTQPTFNPNAARTPQQQPDKRAFKGPRRGELSGCALGSFPSDVWVDVPHLGANKMQGVTHPAAFPVTLAKKAILLWTQPGDIVMDFFAGSGTVHEAAIQTGRHYIGADISYAADRTKRAAAARLDSCSLLPGVTEHSMAVWAAEARRREAQAPLITDTQDRQLVTEHCADLPDAIFAER